MNKLVSVLRITAVFVAMAICSAIYLSNALAETKINIPGDIVPSSKNPIIKLTDRGIEPAMTHIKGDEGIVFFLNDTPSSDIRLVIDYGAKRTHCGGTNMRISDDGKIASSRMIGPRDFATTCFHDKGSYKFEVFGLKAKPKGIQSTITFE